MSTPYIPCVDVKALKKFIAAMEKYMKRMENIQDTLETEKYLVGVLGISQHAAREMCLHIEHVWTFHSKMDEHLVFFEELYKKVEAPRQSQDEKRLQLEKEIAEAEAVIEQATARLMTKRAELEKLVMHHPA